MALAAAVRETGFFDEASHAARPSVGPKRVHRRGRFDEQKENVLLVVHETSRTGAPILGWNIGRHLARSYNVVTIHLGDGALTGAFEQISAEVHGPFVGVRHPDEIERTLRRVLDGRKFRYALLNSLESRVLLEPCVQRFIPTVLLVHEFAAYYHSWSILEALDYSTEIVFPASIVAKNAEEHHATLQSRNAQVLPQGQSLVPLSGDAASNAGLAALDRLRREREENDAFIVLGAGYVELRKGVDLFLSVAAATQRGQPSRPVHFVWVGNGFEPNEDLVYSVYLREQVKRSGLIERVTLVGEVPNLEPFYEIADAFALTSRLDPLPNVAIDAAIRGIPVICFKNASGMAELLGKNQETADCVVEYLDAQGAAKVILDFVEDKPQRAAFASATQRFARATFNMEAYVGKLDDLGSAAALRVAQQAADARTLLSDSTFDQEMFLGIRAVAESRPKTIARYLAIAGGRRTDEPKVQDLGLRRPSPGFNRRVYAAAFNATLGGGVDPLADFVRRGKPRGPWQAQVLRPNDSPMDRRLAGKLRIAIQAHFYYPDLAADFVAKLRSNHTPCDLLISTTDSRKAQLLADTLAGYDAGGVKIRVIPNRGRNISALLTAFADDLPDYDVVGHLHGKESRPFHVEMGARWREFLWQNLLGGRHAMLDRIIMQFGLEPDLGLVFPSDPHLVGWGENRDVAISVAERIGYKDPLPEAFDFPVGAMFWARPAALRPLLALRLEWNDYPPEPVPYDGTILHALERAIPFAAQVAGLRTSVTHVPGISR
jgi:glycosyltransferase involved in cell wall biosynthesis